jgi:Holliday junction resolvase
MDNGYEVCRNLSMHGSVDLVAIKGTEVILVDVKQGHGTGKRRKKLTPQQEDLGVVQLLATDSGFFWDRI